MSDLRLALRSLARHPGFTAVCIVTLAVGLGATTAIFSAVHAVLLAPLPFAEPGQLVSVRALVQRDTWERRNFSAPDFRDYRAQATRTLAGFSAVNALSYNLTGDGEAVRVAGERVSASYFSVLGVAPGLGRTFADAEDAAPELPPLVVLGHDLWRTRYASDPAILGRTLRLNETNFTVVGVMPPGFRGLDGSAQLWVPLSTLSRAVWDARGNRGIDAIARLRPGATLAQAREELADLGRRLAEAHPGTNANYSADAVPLREELAGDLRQPLLVLLAAVGFVLLLACTNVANLLLVRLAVRGRELAIRLSLGASRGAIARLFLAEAAVLALAGGALGLLLATWLVAALAHWLPVDLPPIVALGLHPAAVGFAAGATVLSALLVGTLPALLAGRRDLAGFLKDGGRSGPGAAGARLRAALVVSELALSLVLLVAAVLFVRSFIRLVDQPTGYRTERLVTQRLTLPALRYDRDAMRRFARTLQERAAALPGVTAAAVATDTPLEGNWSATFFTVEGAPAAVGSPEGRAFAHTVSHTFFATAGLTLLRGRTFAPSYPAGHEIEVVVSENLARRYWPGADAVGRRLKAGRADSTNPWMRVVGVVAETRYRGLASNVTADPDLYGSLDQRPAAGLAVLVQTAGDSRSVGPDLRRLIAALDPNIPAFGLATIEERIARASARQRFSAQLMAAFAVVALLLAALGLYGVVTFGVGQRTREIGVRMALGARPADILRMVIGDTGRLVLLGLAAGTALAFALAPSVGSLLFRVDPRDPLTYAAVAGLLALVAAFAAWLPARRAARVDPTVALRAD